MEWLIIGGIIVAFLAVAQWRGWVDLTGKHESSGGMGLLGLADELFAPNRHEIQNLREEERRLPAPTADAPDDHLGIARVADDAPSQTRRYGGRYRLDLD